MQGMALQDVKEMTTVAYVGKPANCNKCGAKIGFFKTKAGKWMKVNLFWIHGEWIFKTGMGNHGNYTPWHVCPKPTAPPEPTLKELEVRMKDAGIYDACMREIEVSRKMMVGKDGPVWMLDDPDFLKQVFKSKLEKTSSEYPFRPTRCPDNVG